MSDMVWCSAALADASNRRPFRNDMGGADKKRLIEIEKQIRGTIWHGTGNLPRTARRREGLQG